MIDPRHQLRVIILCRVSTDEQGESGLGLEAQEHACREWVARNGAFVDLVFHEVIKGATPLSKRTVLGQALNAIHPGTILLVAKLDRLSRANLHEQIMLERDIANMGGRIVSAAGEGTEEDSPQARLFRGILQLIAGYEREIICARTSAGVQAKLRRGERHGPLRYGTKIAPDGVMIIPDEQQLEIARVAIDLRANHLWSYAHIAFELNRQKQVTPNGHKWNRFLVERMLKRTGHNPQKLPQNVVKQRNRASGGTPKRTRRAAGTRPPAVAPVVDTGDLAPGMSSGQM